MIGEFRDFFPCGELGVKACAATLMGERGAVLCLLKSSCRSRRSIMVSRSVTEEGWLEAQMLVKKLSSDVVR